MKENGIKSENYGGLVKFGISFRFFGDCLGMHWKHFVHNNVAPLAVYWENVETETVSFSENYAILTKKYANYRHY